MADSTTMHWRLEIKRVGEASPCSQCSEWLARAERAEAERDAVIRQRDAIISVLESNGLWPQYKEAVESVLRRDGPRAIGVIAL